MARLLGVVAALLAFAAAAVAAPASRYQYPDTRLQTQEAPVSAKAWKPAEKQKVEEAIAALQKTAPGVVQRAAAYRPVRVYRTDRLGADELPVGMVAAESALFVSDAFFTGTAAGKFAMKDTGFALARALAHLADPAGRVSGGKEWVVAAQPLLDRARQRARELKTTLTALSSAGDERIAAEIGFPTTFAAFTRAEALAQFTAAVATRKDFAAPPAVKAVVDKRMLATGGTEEAMKKFVEGLAFVEQGKFDEAVKAYDQAIKLDSSFRDAYFRRGLVEKYRSQWEKAIVNYELAVKTSNGAPPLVILLERGFAYMQRKEAEKAIADLTAVIAEAPGPAMDYYPRALGLRAEALMLRKEWSKAADDFTAILALDPGHEPSWRLRGRAKFEMQDAVGAIGDLDKAISLDAQDPDAYFVRGFAYGSLKQYKKAKSDLERALGLAPNLQALIRPALDFVDGEIAKGK